jgi:hypothetical protein
MGVTARLAVIQARMAYRTCSPPHPRRSIPATLPASSWLGVKEATRSTAPTEGSNEEAALPLHVLLAPPVLRLVRDEEDAAFFS